MEELKLNRENLHIHSNYSWDCKMELSKICELLVADGITHACITDHVEFDRENVNMVKEKMRIRNLEIDKLNYKYDGKLKLLKGIEVTTPHKYPKEFNELQKVDFDMIMGSIHKIPRANSELEKKSYTYAYYNEILKMVKFGGFDVVGHIDYINRYYGNGNTIYNQLAQIFSEIKYQNMIIEVNTSALRRCNQICFPSPEKLKYYKEFGNHITIGTDAHDYDELNSNLLNVEYLTGQMGLVPVYYEKRKKKVLNPSTYS